MAPACLHLPGGEEGRGLHTHLSERECLGGQGGCLVLRGGLDIPTLFTGTDLASTSHARTRCTHHLYRRRSAMSYNHPMATGSAARGSSLQASVALLTSIYRWRSSITEARYKTHLSP